MFLGHIICPGQILPDPTKITHVEQFPLLVNSHQLHSFLGLINYLHDFVPNLADHTVMLHATLPLNAAAEKAYYKAVKMHKGHLPEGWIGWRWSFGPAEKAAFEATRLWAQTCHTAFKGIQEVVGVRECFEKSIVGVIV